ncbi:7-carboxy-7-deazaguanine synthase QueE [Streptomyces sp. 205]|uniref:7-carboxy-7-deazaguanine synthase n=1 Tax=Streptomyces coffeae TaxID=621382 RepID=A0ABS1NE25_9ACTN|nr:7-carboxy-7-deazaguanine synthase QueE [Streptomyces coffeae]
MLHLLDHQAVDDRGLFIADTFGPTFQGEGPSLGRQALFIRLSHCNLSCGQGPGARWACDTAYTWDFKMHDPQDPKIRRRVLLDDLMAWVKAHTVRLVVITGGEPLLQRLGLERLVAMLHAEGYEIEIETNGTLIPSEDLVATVTAFNVSPKLVAAGGREIQRVVPAALAAFASSGKARFTFVVSELAEFKEIADLPERFAMDEIWVMPEGTSADMVRQGMRTIAEEALACGWNLSPRLHVELWEDKRGR